MIFLGIKSYQEYDVWLGRNNTMNRKEGNDYNYDPSQTGNKWQYSGNNYRLNTHHAHNANRKYSYRSGQSG